MVRIKRGVQTRRRHKKIIAQAKGYHGIRNNIFRYAKMAVIKAGMRSYVDRRLKKRNFRSLWTIRINAGARALGTNYSTLIAAMTKKSILINRKMLAQLAMKDEAAFAALVKVVLK